jgi:hypothetical protein
MRIRARGPIPHGHIRQTQQGQGEVGKAGYSSTVHSTPESQPMDAREEEEDPPEPACCRENIGGFEGTGSRNTGHDAVALISNGVVVGGIITILTHPPPHLCANKARRVVLSFSRRSVLLSNEILQVSDAQSKGYYRP